MTHEAPSDDLMERLGDILAWMVGPHGMKPGWQAHGQTLYDARTRITQLGAEVARLREALEACAARCTICSGGGSIVEEDSATGALLWRDCPGCTPARAALAGDSHDQ